MDPIWAGVIGTIAGGIVGSATSLLSPLILWRTEEKRLKLEHTNAMALNEIERGNELERIEKTAAIADKAHKRELVASWRIGLDEGARTYLVYEQDQSSTALPPSVSGTPWYESLRPHLRFAVIIDVNLFLTGTFVTIDPSAVTILSSQIATIESDWKLL